MVMWTVGIAPSGLGNYNKITECEPNEDRASLFHCHQNVRLKSIR